LIVLHLRLFFNYYRAPKGNYQYPNLQVEFYVWAVFINRVTNYLHEPVIMPAPSVISSERDLFKVQAEVRVRLGASKKSAMKGGFLIRSDFEKITSIKTSKKGFASRKLVHDRQAWTFYNEVKYELRECNLHLLTTRRGW
jgi:hypothetical protein